VIPFADTQFVEATGVWIIKSLVIFALVLGIVPMILLLERKLLGRFQQRYGPNRVGPFGLLQPLADVLKLLSKEQATPQTGAPLLMALAPALAILTSVASLAIIPFGNVKEGFGTEYGLYGIDVNIGILYAFAFGSISFYALLLGGWASGSKYSFLGAMRSAAQLISYEVALALGVIGVVMMAGSLSLVDIVEAQGGFWYIGPQFVGFLIFMIAGFAETNRAPFDLPEADAELVAGYNTEFGGMRFGSFFMAEYINMLVISGLGAAMFLGGWMGPGPGWLDPFWMLLKIMLLICFFIWVRATLPRLRYDQLMSFGWKVLLPLATLNLFVTAVVIVLTT
jgi:NADH-quinone oxidoreductase subunit H